MLGLKKKDIAQQRKEKIEKAVSKISEEDKKKLIDELNDPEFKKAVIKATNDSDNEGLDPTKFTLLENLHNRDTADYYTWYKKVNEIEQVNRLQTWARLMPIVFGDSDVVRKCQAIVNEHCKDNMVNRASKDRGRESALVYAVKQDTGMVQTDQQVAKFLKK